jgi:SAM-dependent methyltransferase
VSAPLIPPHLLARLDESPDPLFYREPRFVTHIDDATIEALTSFYRERLPADAAVLDLMSSWVSHLPEEARYRRVAGLGMNHEELAANPRLTDYAVQDLNESPALAYEDQSFDAVLVAVSVQYLTRPVEVFAEIRRVLRPGGEALIAVSHRIFPTKAIALFRSLPPTERPRVVSTYFEHARGFEEPECIDRTPASERPVDPLWVVAARRRSFGDGELEGRSDEFGR